MAKISRSLMEEGYAVGNHSLTHAQLSRTTGDALRQQVLDTDTLLKDVDSKPAAGDARRHARDAAPPPATGDH
ncbi:hypothetical protein G6F66_015148 [Rhizopus arrhizus]|nr:hypothetical protein G6F66_015148 [Rhizopus arrhizus]